MEKEAKQVTDSSVKKDIIAIISFILGLLSIPFYFIGIVPSAAIVFGLLGISRTNVAGSGRWMVVTGLVLGCIYLAINVYRVYGYYDTGITNNTASVQKETSALHAEVVKLELKDKSESYYGTNFYEIHAEVTNVSERPIRAFKGSVVIEDIFGEHIAYINIVRADTLLPNEKVFASQPLVSGIMLVQFGRLQDAGKIENLKVEFKVLEIIYGN